MDEYIEREELIEHLERAKEKLLIENSFESRWAANLIGIFIWLVENFASADVAPVRHGEWVEEDTAITCPICTRSYDTDFEIKRSVVLRFKYCPECGAKMDGDKNG